MTPHGRPRINLTLSGVLVKALVDTGATCSLLQRNVYQTIARASHRSLFVQPAPNLQGVNGHVVTVIGETELRIDHVRKPVKFRIVDDLNQDMILGCDILDGAQIDMSRRVLTMHGHRWPLYSNDVGLAGLGSVLPVTGSPKFNQLLRRNADVFSVNDDSIGNCKINPMHIETTGPPISLPAYRTPIHKRKLVDDAIDEMLNQQIIRPSISSWAAPVTLIPKKDGTTRFCVDYRKLNDVTVKDQYPIRNIKTIFDSLGGSTVFSALDLRSGYHQIRLDQETIPKSAFVCHRGLFEFLKMPFGLATAPSWFQRIMDTVLEGLIGKICLVYLDDIVVFSPNEEDHLKHLQLVFDRLRSAGLRLKPTKCHIGLKQIKLLGHVVSADGISSDPEKVKAIQLLPTPTNIKQVRCFLGMTGYYRDLIPRYADIAEPLVNLTRKHVRFQWQAQQEEAFNALKRSLISRRIMAAPRLDRPFKLYTDASDVAVGAILVQDDDKGVERVIQYVSHALSPVQRRWACIEREAYAIIYAIEKLRPYLYGAKFLILTDHKPLRSLFTKQMANTRIQRWSILLSEFGAKICYHKGKLNVRADLLFRMPPHTVQPYYVGIVDNEDWISPDALQEDRMEDVLPLIYDGIDLNTIKAAQEKEFPQERMLAVNEDSDYTLIKGVLYSVGRPNPLAATYPRLMLPKVYRSNVIIRAHKEVGHMSIMKTFHRVLEAYVWPGMRRDIKEVIKLCATCQLYSQHRDKVPFGKMEIPHSPMSIISADLSGPYIRSTNGNRYILTIMCHHTGWVEAIPIKDKTNASVWTAFATHFFPVHSFPQILITDNGLEFCAQAWEKYLQNLGIEHRCTPPYRPQANSINERSHRSIKSMISKLCSNRTADWEIKLPDVLLAHRISVSSTSGFSPFYLLYGRRPRMPMTKLLSARHSNYFGSRLDTLASMLKQARANTARNRAQVRERIQSRANAKQVKIGDSVVVLAAEPMTFTSRWDPEFEVYRIRGSTLWVRHQPTGKTKIIHRDRCRFVDPNICWDEVRPRPLRQQRRLRPHPTQMITARPVTPEPDVTRSATASRSHSSNRADSVPRLVLQRTRGRWTIDPREQSPSVTRVLRKRRLTPPSLLVQKRARCDLVAFVSHFLR